MEEADRLSDRIMMLNHGDVVMHGTVEELKRHISPPNTYKLALTLPKADEYHGMLTYLAQDAAVIDPETLRFKLKRPEDLSAIMARIVPADLKSLGLAEADLETVYLTVAGQQVPLSALESPPAKPGPTA
jgi:ABC-2 type transport system ATP-binding protein